MNIAKGIGIDGFALDIGKDSYNDQQLGFAYAAAQAVNFSVFIRYANDMIGFPPSHLTCSCSVSTSATGTMEVCMYLLLPTDADLRHKDVGTMSTYMQTYGNLPAQFKFNGAAFVSSFIGDGFPYRQVESQSGVKLFACPNWQPGSLSGNDK